MLRRWVVMRQRWRGCSPRKSRRFGILTRREVLVEDSTRDQAAISKGPWVSALLAGQQDDGGFGGDPYRKWTG
ncbi:MAG: hypothetical protein WKF82_13925, partial [Nocardioidaceae bacterium]